MYYVLFSDHRWYMAFDLDGAKELVANHKWDERLAEGLRWWKIFHCYERKMWEEVLTDLE